MVSVYSMNLPYSANPVCLFHKIDFVQAANAQPELLLAGMLPIVVLNLSTGILNFLK
jgi:hypothetical protein